MAWERIQGTRKPHILIGGYGMGFTLRAALRTLPEDSKLTVVELVPEIIEWARGPMAELTGDCLDDPRVTLWRGDVTDAIVLNQNTYDAILLDVDNGPSFLIHDENARVYSADFLATCLARLAPGGRLVIWCEQASPDLEITLRRLTKSVQLIPIPVTREGRSFEYALYRALAR